MTFGPVRVNFSVPRSDPYDHGAKAGWGKWGEESGQETVEKRHQERAGQSGQVCNFFSKAGWCKWGDTCIHKHMSEGQGTGPEPIPEPQLADSHPGKSGEICRFFSKAGWCKHGDTCIHKHMSEGQWTAHSEPIPEPQLAHGHPGKSGEVCNFFSKAGWCKWGDTCIHKHMSDGQGTVPIPEPQLADSHPGKSREICRFFSKTGWCKHRDTCIHAHVLGDDTTEGRPKEADSGSRVEEGPPDPQEREHTGTSGQVCNFFSKAGWCKYGDGCIHAHILGGKHERLCDLAGELEFSFMTQAGRVWGLGLGSLLPTLRRSASHLDLGQDADSILRHFLLERWVVQVWRRLQLLAP